MVKYITNEKRQNDQLLGYLTNHFIE